MAQIKKGEVRIEKTVLTCTVCSHFQTGRKRDDQGNTFCSLKKKASHQTFACADFALHPFIWCRKNAQFYDVKVCLSRQERRIDGCRNCFDGKRIQKYVKENSNE